MTEWKHSINSYIRIEDGKKVKYFNGKFEFSGISQEVLEELLKLEDKLVTDND